MLPFPLTDSAMGRRSERNCTLPSRYIGSSREVEGPALRSLGNRRVPWCGAWQGCQFRQSVLEDESAYRCAAGLHPNTG